MGEAQPGPHGLEAVQVFFIGPFPSEARHLQDERYISECRMAHYHLEPMLSYIALADVFVTVLPGAMLDLGVVGVDHDQPG